MTKAQVMTYVGTALGVIFAGVAVKFPQYQAPLYSATTFLFGWLHLRRPLDAAPKP